MLPSARLAIKCDRDVSSSTMHGCLKPDNSAEVEQLAKASGQNDAKRKRACKNLKWIRLFFFGTKGTGHDGQP
jgi:hypothetical protein